MAMPVKGIMQRLEKVAVASGFSGVVSISWKGEEPQRRAFGLRNRAEGLPNTPDTRLAIASGTKLFTALAVGRLVQEGKLAPGAAVGAVAGDFSGWIDPSATIGQLLSHTSGCWDYLDEETMEDYGNYRLDVPWYDLAGPADYLPLFAGHEPKFAPSSRFSYSNGGYVALAAIGERVSGRLYREYVRTEVLEPAGMASSGFFAFDELPPNTALGYMGAEGLKTNCNKLPLRGGGDGGMYTTAADLDALWDSLLAHRVLKEGLLEEWLAPRVDISERSSYGYGVYRRKKDGSCFIVGGDHGVGFDARCLPERGVTTSILSNVGEGEEAMREALLEALDG